MCVCVFVCVCVCVCVCKNIFVGLQSKKRRIFFKNGLVQRNLYIFKNYFLFLRTSMFPVVAFVYDHLRFFFSGFVSVNIEVTVSY